MNAGLKMSSDTTTASSGGRETSSENEEWYPEADYKVNAPSSSEKNKSSDSISSDTTLKRNGSAEISLSNQVAQID